MCCGFPPFPSWIPLGIPGFLEIPGTSGASRDPAISKFGPRSASAAGICREWEENRDSFPPGAGGGPIPKILRIFQDLRIFRDLRIFQMLPHSLEAPGMKLRLRAPGFSGIGEVLGFSWDLGSSEGSGEAPGGKGGVTSRFFPLLEFQIPN